MEIRAPGPESVSCSLGKPQQRVAGTCAMGSAKACCLAGHVSAAWAPLNPHPSIPPVWLRRGWYPTQEGERHGHTLCVSKFHCF